MLILHIINAQPTPNNIDGTVKNATSAVPKYLSNFLGSLEISLINCKVELKIKWTKYCVLAAAGNGHTNANPDNIVLTIKDTNLHVSVVFLSVKNKQKLLKSSQQRI